MKIRIILFIIAGYLATTFIGCNTNTPDPQPTSEYGIEDMQVPDGFTFKTTHEVSLTIKMPQSLDFTDLRSRFDVYTANPNDGGKLITSGSFDENGEFNGLIRVPTALTEVFVASIAGNATVAIENSNYKEGGVIIDFGGDYGFNPPDTIEPDTKKSATILSHIEGNRNFMSTNNIIGNGDFETNDFGSVYRWYYHNTVESKWYFDRYKGTMEWYNDDGNGVVRTPWTESGSQYYYGATTQVIDAEPGDVISFSADIKSVGNNSRLYSWLYIVPLNSNNNIIKYFTLKYYHPSSDWTNKQIVATMPAGTVKAHILIWTNDYTAEAAVYVDNVVVTGPVTDSDGDGVDDDLDDYPNDSDRAFDVYYPNDTDWGTLVYEDLWPGTGDYDFNDLVLDYQFKSVLNSQNGLVEFFTDYSVRAVGASLHNAFGFSLGGDPSNVASVSGNNVVHGDLNINANGTEQNQSNTVVFMFDDAFDMIGSSGSTFINTQPGVPYVEPETNTVHVLYETPISASVTGTAPYNPFIVIDLPKSRDAEVHLPGNPPTDLADASLFGLWADDTNPSAGKYYQTTTNLPWALDIPVKFDYPVEQVEIIDAYNHFVEWAESAGSVYTDWYEDKSGYRNSDNIYSPSK